MMDPNQQQEVYVDENGQPLMMDPNQQQQVIYVDENGNQVEAPSGAEQQVMYVDEAGNPVNMDPGQVVYADPAQIYVPPAAPARVNVSPEIFAKLAQGLPLTPEEQAQLTGEAPAAAAPAALGEIPAPAAPAAPHANAAPVAGKEEAASKKKKSLKTSKKAK